MNQIKKKKGKSRITLLVILAVALGVATLFPVVAMSETSPAREENKGKVEVKEADPFQPFIDILTEKELKEKEKGARLEIPRPPLERYGIEEFSLVGISKTPTSVMAVVEDSQGKSYSLYVGTHIGMNNGIVKTITDEHVIVVETQKDMSEKLVTREVALKFKSQETEE